MQTVIKKKRKGLRPMQVIMLGMLGLIFAGSLVLWLPFCRTGDMTYIDALFTSASAVCLTGLTTVKIAQSFNVVGQIVVLLLIQVGGLGIMTFATLLLMLLRKKFTLKDRLVMQEALGSEQNKGVVRLTRDIARFTFAVEGCGFLLLLIPFIKAAGAKGAYFALFTAVSAFCNAGMTLFGNSLTDYGANPFVVLPIALLIILGGLGFVVAADMGRYRFSVKKYHLHSKIALAATAALLFFGTVVFYLCERNNPDTLGGANFGYTLMNAFFEAVTLRTAGFQTLNQSALTAPSKLFSFILMFIGGSPGSAAGGIKTTTVAVLLLMLMAGLRRKSEIVVFKREVSHKTCVKAAATLMAGLLIVSLAAFLLLVIQHPSEFDTEAVVFEAVSAFSTVGVSEGITPLLTTGGKVIVIFAMFFGKTGAITVGSIMFSGGGSEAVRYPEGNVSVG
ncbi:MAG: Trk family potassium uptake protein [Firmicutes bacterium]|nr:Trk family potassium uptake protein [Bacillota bacterium]